MVNMVSTSYARPRETTTSEDEVKLVMSAQKGDHEAFNQLVLRYQDMIFNLALRILGDKDSADDITQNTFLTAYLNLPRFRNGSFRSWIYRIATNACYDEYRQHKRYPLLSIENEDLVEEKLVPLSDFSNARVLPETEYERRELAHIIQKALDRLDVDQRLVVVLVDQQDFDYQEAAQVLGIPIGTVKSRLARARMRLHELLRASISNN